MNSPCLESVRLTPGFPRHAKVLTLISGGANFPDSALARATRMMVKGSTTNRSRERLFAIKVTADE